MGRHHERGLCNVVQYCAIPTHEGRTRALLYKRERRKDWFSHLGDPVNYRGSFIFNHFKALSPSGLLNALDPLWLRKSVLSRGLAKSYCPDQNTTLTLLILTSVPSTDPCLGSLECWVTQNLTHTTLVWVHLRVSSLIWFISFSLL